MRIWRYFLEGDPPRAIYPFLFFCVGILGTYINYKLIAEEYLFVEIVESSLLGRWEFVDISF